MLVKIQEINTNQSPLPTSTRLLSMDVTAMYPSIPPAGGVASSERALHRSGMAAGKVDWLVRVLKAVLEYNVFEWDGELYQQLYGTAIGTSCAPAYSGLYMEELTVSAMKDWVVTHPDPEESVKNWVRLIDDGWGMWTGSLDVLHQFLDHMNSRVPSIKFTMEYTCPVDCPEADNTDHDCRRFLNFLDLRMFVDDGGKIQTDLFVKPGRKCQYLSPDSSHPRNVFKNIPKSLSHRIVRIVRCVKSG